MGGLVARRAQPLPAAVSHHLRFTFAGRNIPLVPPSNDGVVSVGSQLASPIQEQAAEVRGFALPHAGTLYSDEAVRWVQHCLK